MSATKAVAQPKRNRGRPKQENVGDIEKVILDVALEEFLEHGYGGASISRMVRDAGISKTTMYSRFASKAELFRAIMENQVESFALEDLFSSHLDKLNLAQGLKLYANHILGVSMEGEMLGINRLMYSESYRFPELRETTANRTAKGIRRIAEFIQQSCEAEGFTCSDPRSVAEIFILTIRGWYFDLMLTGEMVTTKQREAWVERLVDVLLSAKEDW